jgi:predicted ArsR family transcriptional regulator
MKNRLSIQDIAEKLDISWNVARRMLVVSEHEGKVSEWSDLAKESGAVQNPITGRITVDAELFEKAIESRGFILF